MKKKKTHKKLKTLNGIHTDLFSQADDDDTIINLGREQ